MQITFDQDYPGYGPGVVADFADREAVRLLNLRVPVAGEDKPLCHVSTSEEIEAAATPKAPPPAELHKLVRIVKESYGAYQRGNVAAFPESMCLNLIAQKIAVWHSDPIAEEQLRLPRSTFNARAAVLRSIEGYGLAELQFAYMRFLGGDPGKKTEAVLKKTILENLEPRTGGPLKSPKTGETKPTIAK